jgi:hypothetical protein
MKAIRIAVALFAFLLSINVDAATAFHTAGSNVTPASPLSITPGASANDVMIEAVITDTNTATTFTFPTNFTQLFNTVTGSSDGGALAVAYNKQATGSEGATSTSNSPSQNIIGAIASFSGVDNTTPLDVTPPAAVVQSTTVANPLVMVTNTITTVTNGDMIVVVRLTDVTASQANAITCSTSTGSTGAWTSLDYNSGFYNVSICYAQQTTAGAVAASTTNSGSVSAAGIVYIMALRPAASGTTIALVAGSAAFTGSTPAVSVGTTIAPVAGSAAFTGSVRTVTVTNNVSIAPVAGSAAFTGSVPTATATAYTWYSLPAPGSYDNNSILTGQTYPTSSILRVVTDFAHITANYATGPLQNDINDYATAATGYTGSDSATYEIKNPAGATSQYTITANINASSVIGFSSGAFAFTGNTPSVLVGVSIAPVAGSAAFTGNTPTVAVTGNVSIAPVAGSTAFTGSTPGVIVTGGATIALVAGSAAFTGAVPTVSVNGNTSISPVAGAMTYTGAVPTVVATGNITIAPVPGSEAFIGAIPAISNGANGVPVKFQLQQRRRRFFKAA